jgi:hypothetical protein
VRNEQRLEEPRHEVAYPRRSKSLGELSAWAANVRRNKMRQYKYIVEHGISGHTTVRAASAAAAKREVCRMYGIRPSDPWCGLSNMSAWRAD